MSQQQIGVILQNFSQTCTFPNAADLDDTTCKICYNDSLGVHGTESPVRLSCGHVFGMNCLLKWASTNIESRTVCTYCRTPFLTTATTNPGRPSHGMVARTTSNEQVHYLLPAAARNWCIWCAEVIGRDNSRTIRLLFEICLLLGFYLFLLYLAFLGMRLGK